MSEVMETRRVGLADRIENLARSIDSTLGAEADPTVMAWIAELETIAELARRSTNDSLERVTRSYEAEKQRRREARAELRELRNALQSLVEEWM